MTGFGRYGPRIKPMILLLRSADKGVSHIWRVETNAHDTGAMSANFYHFAQKLFKE
jgi:hypothetical protein